MEVRYPLARAADQATDGCCLQWSRNFTARIGVLGPHWRYDIKEDEQDQRSLIAWHDTTHGKASYADLQALVALVAAM